MRIFIIMGLRVVSKKKSPNPAKAWSELPETLQLAAERLVGVQIEKLPAIELIKRYDTPDVFIYADPPYLHETRKNYLYKYEMTDAEHLELLEILKNHPGPVMISGYESELYNDMLSDWRKVKKETLAEGGLKRTEVIWMNYSDTQMSFTDMNQCEGQMSLMDLLSPAEREFKPGDWIEMDNVGEQLTFDEITQMIGQLIVMDKSTVSHEWYKVVLVEKIVLVENNTQRRLIYYDGTKQRGLVNEMWFNENVSYPARAYKLKK